MFNSAVVSGKHWSTVTIHHLTLKPEKFLTWIGAMDIKSHWQPRNSWQLRKELHFLWGVEIINISILSEINKELIKKILFSFLDKAKRSTATTSWGGLSTTSHELFLLGNSMSTNNEPHLSQGVRTQQAGTQSHFPFISSGDPQRPARTYWHSHPASLQHFELKANGKGAL